MTGAFAGSFDPITSGHLDIIKNCIEYQIDINQILKDKIKFSSVM